MKKTTGFKQREGQIDGSLDRAKELNTFCNKFRSGTSSSSSSSLSSSSSSFLPPAKQTLTLLTCPIVHISHWFFCFYKFVFNQTKRRWTASPCHVSISSSQEKRDLEGRRGRNKCSAKLTDHTHETSYHIQLFIIFHANWNVWRKQHSHMRGHSFTRLNVFECRNVQNLSLC